MKNIPQPSDNPYEAGDLVRIHLGEDDADAEFHGLVCVVIDRFRDDLDSETGRDLDAFSYRLSFHDIQERVYRRIIFQGG